MGRGQQRRASDRIRDSNELSLASTPPHHLTHRLTTSHTDCRRGFAILDIIARGFAASDGEIELRIPESVQEVA